MEVQISYGFISVVLW